MMRRESDIALIVTRDCEPVTRRLTWSKNMRKALLLVCLLLAPTTAPRTSTKQHKRRKRRKLNSACTSDSSCADGLFCDCSGGGRRLFGAPAGTPAPTCACQSRPSPPPPPAIPPPRAPPPASPPLNIGCSAWESGSSQNSQYFNVLLPSQPASWTVQMWVKRMTATGYWFSLARNGGSDNCILLNSGEQGFDGTWRQYVVVISGSQATFYRDGVSQGTSGFCGGSDFSFVLGNDQDGYQYVNDPSQACGMRVAAVALYDFAWSGDNALAAAGKAVWEPSATHAWKASSGTADLIGSISLANTGTVVADSYYAGCS